MSGLSLLLLLCFTEIPVCDANSVDPDKMLHFVASDLDLHCLSMSLLWDARHKLVSDIYAIFFSHHENMPI